MENPAKAHVVVPIRCRVCVPIRRKQPRVRTVVPVATIKQPIKSTPITSYLERFVRIFELILAICDATDAISK